MRTIVLVLMGASFASAQGAGERAYEQTCGSGYCHNGRGVGGGAPRLAARGFDFAYIRNTVTNGVPGTSMPAFGPSLPAAELDAVVDYVAELNGIGRRSGEISVQVLPVDAQRGRTLFAEAVRGFARCSTCHQENGLGIPITPPIFNLPANAAALKSLATLRMSTATVDGASMPALLVAAKSTSVVFYDLTSAPPVKRTVTPAAFANRDGSTWRHASVTGSYSDAELTAILAFLKAVRR